MSRRVGTIIMFMLAACAAFALCACTQPYEPQMRDQAVDDSALNEPGTLRVGVDASSYPFAGQSGSRIKGIDVDVAAAVADRLGLSIELVDVGMTGAAALDEESVDVVMSVNAQEASSAGRWLSDPYLGAGVCVFARSGDSAPVKAENPVITAQESSLSSVLVNDTYGSECLQTGDDLKELFQAVADGTQRYVAADAVVGLFLSESMGLDLQMVCMLEEPSGYHIAASQDNEALQQAISQALGEISSNGVLDVIALRWLGGSYDLGQVPQADVSAQQGENAEAQAQPEGEQPAEGQPAEEAAAEQPAEEPAAEQPAEEAVVERPAEEAAVEQPAEEPAEVWQEPAAEEYADNGEWQEPAADEYVDDGEWQEPAAEEYADNGE